MINTYNESDLHRELKELYCPKNAKTEVPLLGSICDILCANKKIIEVQTSNLSALRLKLEKFLPSYKVEIIYPIIVDAYILLLDKDGLQLHRRKSPKHGIFFQLFRELSGLYHLIDNKKLSLKVLYIECEVIKQQNTDLRKTKRHKNRASIINKKLIKILKTEDYKSLKQVCQTALNLLSEEFTNKDIKKLGAGKYASYTSWFLKKVELIRSDGRVGNYIKYIKQ